jgi:Na+-translocating ferredoxin:NAD+ oxidoreductase RNF subunit RnfB
MYEKGEFQSEKKTTKLASLFGAHRESLTIEAMQKIDKIMELITGVDCTACGSPDCRTFAEDVVRGNAALKECLFVDTRTKKKR